MMVSQMYKWKQLALFFQENSIPWWLHKKEIWDLRECQDKFLTFLRFKWEKYSEELQPLQYLMKRVKAQQEEKEKVIELVQELLICSPPSLAYPLCLHEQYLMFQLQAIQETIPCNFGTLTKFSDTFFQGDFVEQHLLYELFLHRIIIPHNSKLVIPLMLGTSN